MARKGGYFSEDRRLLGREKIVPHIFRSVPVFMHYVRRIIGHAYEEPELTLMQKFRSQFILSGTRSVASPRAYFPGKRGRLRVIDDVAGLPHALWKEHSPRHLPPPYGARSAPSVPLWKAPSASFILSVAGGFVSPDGLVFDRGAIYRNAKWYYEPPRDGLPVVHCKKIITFIQLWSDGYVHFIFDTLPRLDFAYDLIQSDPGIKVLVPDHPFIADALREMEVEASRVIFQNRAYVYAAEVVYYPHFYSHGRPVKMGLIPRGSLDRARAKLSGPAPVRRDKVVYLKRPSHRSRNVKNELALLEKIEKRLAARYRLEVFDPSNNWMQDREVMKRARVVLGPHGGAWSNIIFCDEDTDVIEFLPLLTLRRRGKNERPCFYGLAGALGLRYWFVEPKRFEFDNPHVEMEVDDGKVLSILRRIGILNVSR
jgi:hypothetical protein